MADLLRQGATLTEHSCPACASPLFKLRSGDLWCGSCKKRVMIVREGEPEPETSKASAFSSLESTILGKIQAIEKQLADETDAEKLNALGATLSTLLENLLKPFLSSYHSFFTSYSTRQSRFFYFFHNTSPITSVYYPVIYIDIRNNLIHFNMMK